MEAYINSLACISPQNTVEEDFFFENPVVTPTSNSFHSIPADYKNYIPAAMMRRASHVLKMGISAGLMCVKKNKDQVPEAIIVGTAMGCFEDTDKFLRMIDENEEKTLTPTSFIQSTHNTVAGQIALLLKCHGYNFTYVHQNLSFEFALLDALMLLKEKEAGHVLVGGVDELIPPLSELFDRAKHLKKAEQISENILHSGSEGYIAGEGSAFFYLCSHASETTVAKLSGVKTIFHLQDKDALHRELDLFLKEINLQRNNLSLVLSGINGDVRTDAVLKNFTAELKLPTACFKQYCGEYFTASAFAMWLAANIIQKQKLPAGSLCSLPHPASFNHVLIINQSENKHYSFMCLSAC